MRDKADPLKVQRYEDLTSTEIAGMVIFFRLSSQEEMNRAFRAQQVCLDLEHFIATCPLDPNDLTPGDRDEVIELRQAARDITGESLLLNILGELRAAGIPEPQAGPIIHNGITAHQRGETV